VAVKLGARLMGTDPSLALEGQYVVPRRLIDAGHAFRSTEIAHALSLLA
jgi:NAD dependent epimerase/dehydratase family enzyme